MIYKYSTKTGVKYGFVAYLGTDPLTGKRRRKRKQGFKTRTAAKKAEKLAAVTAPTPERKPMTLAELHAEWYAIYKKTVKPSTLQTVQSEWNNDVAPQIGGVRLDKLSPQKLQRFINTVPTRRAGTTARRVARVLKYGVKMGYISTNPMERVEIPRASKSTEHKRIKFLTRKQVTRLLDNIKHAQNVKPEAKRRDLVLFTLLIYSGLRVGEACALEWSDITPDGAIKVTKTITQGSRNGEGYYYVSETPKTVASYRTVYVGDKVMKLLTEWHAYLQATKPTRFVFPSSNPERPFFSMMAVYRLKKYLDGLPDITPHALRHTHASLLFASGASMKDVQVQLGHSSIGTTMNIYTHIVPEQTRKTTARFLQFMDEENKPKNSTF